MNLFSSTLLCCHGRVARKCLGAAMLGAFLAASVRSKEGQLPVTDAPEMTGEEVRFVVMPDRTGGMRGGVFKRALPLAT